MCPLPKPLSLPDTFYPLDQVMASVQYDPEAGYYTTRDPIGGVGDFITAPEISQIFGELVGAWFLDQHLQRSSPQPFCLLEMGPGRGTLMADMLRVFRLRPQVLDAMHLIMLEVNPHLQAQQQRALGQQTCTWVQTLESALTEAAGRPLYVVANEFFDALPIKQYLYQDGWHERGIQVQPGGLKWATRPTGDAIYLKDYPQPKNQSILEQGEMGVQLLQQLASYQRMHGGVLMVLDYGYGVPQYGETLQAVLQHKVVDVLATLGHADLSAHVNFYRFQELLQTQGARRIDIESQRAFLLRCGFYQRLQALCQRAEATHRPHLYTQAHRLLDPHQMGLVFKVLTAVFESS